MPLSSQDLKQLLKISFQMSETPLKVYFPSPAVGSDNEEIFKSLGISKSKIDTLKKQGVV